MLCLPLLHLPGNFLFKFSIELLRGIIYVPNSSHASCFMELIVQVPFYMVLAWLRPALRGARGYNYFYFTKEE